MIDNLVLVTDPALPGDSNPLNVQLFLAHRFQWDTSPDLEQPSTPAFRGRRQSIRGKREFKVDERMCLLFCQNYILL